MLPQPLKAHVHHQLGVEMVDLQGDLDAQGGAVLLAAYLRVVTHIPNQPILLNFSGVGYLHKSAISWLVALAVQTRKARQRLMICGLSEHDQRTFEITRLTDLVLLFPDEEQARQYIRVLSAEDDEDDQLLAVADFR